MITAEHHQVLRQRREASDRLRRVCRDTIGSIGGCLHASFDRVSDVPPDQAALLGKMR